VGVTKRQAGRRKATKAVLYNEDSEYSDEDWPKQKAKVRKAKKEKAEVKVEISTNQEVKQEPPDVEMEVEMA